MSYNKAERDVGWPFMSLVNNSEKEVVHVMFINLICSLVNLSRIIATKVIYIIDI